MTKEIKQFVKENYPDSAFYAIVRKFFQMSNAQKLMRRKMI